MGDTSYKDQPKFMTARVYTQLFERIKAHCLTHEIHYFTIYLFGGEPLLAGTAYFRTFIQTARDILEPHVNLLFFTQTNGTLINEEWLSLFEECKVTFGISLDGDKEMNDKNRVDFKGRGTYDKVKKSIDLITSKNISPGINSYVDIDSDSVAIYQHFKELKVGVIDFLVPSANFYQPPKGLYHTTDEFDWSNTPYADWLIRAFDVWFYDSQPKPDIRLFKYLINLILGKQIGYDYLGTTRTELLIFETDGRMEASDDLKVCGNGFTRNKMNIFDNDIDEALTDELVVMYNLSKERLCKQCTACPVQEICGGWYIPTRFSDSNGFNNPSIYCPDILKLITHVQNRMLEEFEKSGVESGVDLLRFEDAVALLKMELNNTSEPTHSMELEFFKK